MIPVSEGDLEEGEYPDSGDEVDTGVKMSIIRAVPLRPSNEPEVKPSSQSQEKEPGTFVHKRPGTSSSESCASRTFEELFERSESLSTIDGQFRAGKKKLKNKRIKQEVDYDSEGDLAKDEGYPALSSVLLAEAASSIDTLACPGCRLRFREPRVLPCLHSFCTPCIEEMTQDDSLTCPVCLCSLELPFPPPLNPLLVRKLNLWVDNIRAPLQHPNMRRKIAGAKGKIKELQEMFSYPEKDEEQTIQKIRDTAEQNIAAIRLQEAQLIARVKIRSMAIREMAPQMEPTLEIAAASITLAEQLCDYSTDEGIEKVGPLIERRMNDITATRPEIPFTRSTLVFHPFLPTPPLGALQRVSSYIALPPAVTSREEFLWPNGAAFHPLGYVIVVDRGNCMFVLDRGGLSVRTRLSSKQGKEGLLKNPGGVAVDKSGCIYVADTGHCRIAVYRQDGLFSHAITGSPPNSTALAAATTPNSRQTRHRSDNSNSRSNSPATTYTAGVYNWSVWNSPGYKSQGDLHYRTERLQSQESTRRRVSDQEGRRDRHYSQGSGSNKHSHPDRRISEDRYWPVSKRRKIATDLKMPRGVAVMSDGYVVVADTADASVKVFTSDGRYVLTLAHDCLAPGGVAVNPRTDCILVCDGQGHCVRVYQRNGRPVTTIGSKGSGDGEFMTPMSVAVDGHGATLVCDSGNNRIQVFDPDYKFVRCITLPAEDPFVRPSSVSVDSDGNILVCDSGKNRVCII